MGIRDHGYYGYAFVGSRPAQIVALSAVIGMVGHFISQDAHAHIAAPGQLVGTLVIASLALLWTLLSVTAYDDTHFPYVATSAVDLLFMIPFIVIAAVLGAPLGTVTCSVLPVASASNAQGLLAIQMGGRTNSSSSSASPSYIIFVGDNQTTCYAIMAVWGLIIALCVLFALSGFATGLLFLGKRRATAAERADAAAAARAASASAKARVNDSEIEMALAPGKAGFDDDGSSMHSSYYHADDGGGSDAPAYPSAGGRGLHPRLSAAVGASE